MIWESHHWKEPLIESAAAFEDFAQHTELSEEDLVKVEKDVFIGFYSIRKLMDTMTISDSTKNLKLVLAWHPNVKKVHEWNSHHLDELYNFRVTNQETRSIRFICNQIIHSFVFAPVENDRGNLEGIVFSSDKDRNNKLYFMDTKQLVEIFRLIGNDYPAHLMRERDPNTGEFKTKVW
jgi:hypothetical protein